MENKQKYQVPMDWKFVEDGTSEATELFNEWLTQSPKIEVLMQSRDGVFVRIVAEVAVSHLTNTVFHVLTKRLWYKLDGESHPAHISRKVYGSQLELADAMVNMISAHHRSLSKSK